MCERMSVRYVWVCGPLFTGLKRLTSLDLERCGSVGEGLRALSELTQLTSLNVGWCRGITDAHLAHVAPLTSLERLELSRSLMTDAGLRQLAGLVRLRQLGMAGCELTDAAMDVVVGASCPSTHAAPIPTQTTVAPRLLPLRPHRPNPLAPHG
jgi:hypothetical protein